MTATTFSLETSASLSFLAVIVLLVVFAYLYRLPNSMPGLGWWTLALVFVEARLLVLVSLNKFDGSDYYFLVDSIQSAIVIAFLGGALTFSGRNIKPVILAGIFFLAAAWSYFSAHTIDGIYIRSVPISLFIGGIAVSTGYIFLKERAKTPNPGLTFAGWIFVIWGLHRMDYPWTRTIEWFAPWGFMMGQMLSLALVLSLIILAFHHMETRLRRTERFLREGAEQMKSIISLSPVPMIVVDPETRMVLFSNPPASRQFPIIPNESGRITIDQMFDTATGERFFQVLKESQLIENFEVLLQTTGDKNFWASLSCVPLDYAGTDAILISTHDITVRKHAEEDLHHQAVTDSLTETFNRRHFMEMSEKELLRARRYDKSLSVIVLDLDNFKSINDAHGHIAGDTVLKIFAHACLDPLRANDILGRIGGEEFAVTLPEADIDAAFEVAERLRQTFEAMTITVGGVAIQGTTSAGVSELTPEDTNIDDVLRRADLALYRAKDAGRNRVAVG